MDNKGEVRERSEAGATRKRRPNRKGNRKKEQIMIIAGVAVAVIVVIIAAVMIFGGKSDDGSDSGSDKKAKSASVIDLSSLKDVVEDTENINRDVYTEESVQVLDAAVEKAKDVIDNSKDQSEIENAHLEVVKAITGLTKKNTSE